VTRWLVLGDPVVSLGAQTLIADGGLVIQDATIVAAGPREQVTALGPFDRVLGSPGHLVMPAPDWTPACSDELYVRCRQAADEHGTQLITHVLETRAEMLFNLQAYGKSAVRRLADLGMRRGPPVGRARHPGRALPARVLPAVVRDARRAGLRLQPEAPARITRPAAAP
jgi:cytosine/adenosine deaminase-related metal-dependent hydrolase